MPQALHPPTYHERDIFHTAALPIYAGVHELGGEHEVHGHDFLEIAVVAGGAGRHVSAHGAPTARRGDVFVLRPGAWHGFADCRRLAVANCCVSATALREKLAFLRDDPALRDLLWVGPVSPGRHGVLAIRIPDAAAQEAFGEIGALEQSLANPATTNRVRLLGRLLAVLGILVESVGARLPDARPDLHPAVTSAAALLDAAPEHPWQTEELARAVNLDPAYLTRLFRTHVGLPPIAYLARIRAERAATLLARTTLSNARIGALVGWPDPTYFARRFRALVGSSPSEYRRRSRDGVAGTHQP